MTQQDHNLSPQPAPSEVQSQVDPVRAAMLAAVGLAHEIGERTQGKTTHISIRPPEPVGNIEGRSDAGASAQRRADAIWLRDHEL
jgi:hypothetical protein